MGVPTTIEEFKTWYAEQNLPPQNVTRFFIGVDYEKPKAFGIYKNEETGQFIVYKNKRDGSRAIRYQGTNEEYAVKELYLRLIQEINLQNERNGRRSKKSKKERRQQIICYIIICAIVFGGLIIYLFFTPRTGYYKYNNDYYYYQGSSWYSYNNYSGWRRTEAPSELKSNYKTYYYSTGYSSPYNVSDFRDTTYYHDYYSSDSSSSWDSSSTDWDSDW